jgi:PKD repeat protein
MKRYLLLSLLALFIISINSCNKDLDPVASFSMSKTTAKVGETITFTNLSKNYGVITWDFGDGSIDWHFNTTHVYSSAGTFNVRLIVFAKNGNKTDIPSTESKKTIIITP